METRILLCHFSKLHLLGSEVPRQGHWASASCCSQHRVHRKMLGRIANIHARRLFSPRFCQGCIAHQWPCITEDGRSKTGYCKILPRLPARYFLDSPASNVKSTAHLRDSWIGDSCLLVGLPEAFIDFRSATSSFSLVWIGRSLADTSESVMMWLSEWLLYSKLLEAAGRSTSFAFFE